MKTRGFEKVARYMDVEFPMPERKTQFSAGYDISAAEEVVLEPGKLGAGAYRCEGLYADRRVLGPAYPQQHGGKEASDAGE